MLSTALHRRIVGLAAAILVLGGGMILTRFATSPPAGSYEITAVLGQAGANLAIGTDVKVRGAKIGEVVALDYVDQRAIARLRLDPEPRLPRNGLELVVTAKTLLGEKQVELSFPQDAFGIAPFLQDGDTVEAARQPTELQAVLDSLGPVLDSIDPQELADLVQALSEQETEAETIRRNLEVGAELADFGDRTSDDVLARFRAFANVADQLAEGADELTLMNSLVDDATRVLVTRTADIDSSLAALSTFAVGFAEFLEVEQDRIATLMSTTDVIGAVLERNMTHIGDAVWGIARYAQGYGEGGPLNDGTEFAWFRILIGGDDTRATGPQTRTLVDDICEDAGPVALLMPLCTGEDAR